MTIDTVDFYSFFIGTPLVSIISLNQSHASRNEIRQCKRGHVVNNTHIYVFEGDCVTQRAKYGVDSTSEQRYLTHLRVLFVNI